MQFLVLVVQLPPLGGDGGPSLKLIDESVMVRGMEKFRDGSTPRKQLGGVACSRSYEGRGCSRTLISVLVLVTDASSDSIIC